MAVTAFSTRKLTQVARYREYYQLCMMGISWPPVYAGVLGTQLPVLRTHRLFLHPAWLSLHLHHHHSDIRIIMIMIMMIIMISPDSVPRTGTCAWPPLW